MVIGQAFRELLKQYCDEHGLTVQELAQVIGRPVGTVKDWLRGRSPKSVRAAVEVCERLGVAPAPILKPDGKARLLESGFSFTFLQERFAERLKVDPFRAYELVIMAGATLHAKLLKAGFPFTSTTLPTGLVCMHADNPQVGKLLIGLAWNGTAILLVVTVPEQEPLLSEPLNEDSFKRAVEILNQ